MEFTATGVCQKLAARIAAVHHARIVAFGRSRNRRRVDVAQRKAQLAERARTLAVLTGRVLAVVGLTAALGFGTVHGRRWMLTSPVFGLQKVAASGHVRVTPAELKRLGGLTRGLNLFSLDPAAVERGVAAHPWVKEVEVRRSFPSSISVRVVEHVPAAILAMGDLYLIDGEGRPFKRLQPGDNADLPLISGLERDAYTLDPEGANAQVRSALAALEAYQRAGLEAGGRLSEARLGATGLVLVTGQGQEVRLPEGDVESALRRLVRVRKELLARRLTAEVIHLDNRARPGWVAVKLPAPVSERNAARSQR